MKNFIYLFVLSSIVFLLLFSGCGTTADIARNSAIYSYKEPVGNKIDVTLGIIQSSYSNQSTVSYYALGYQSQSVNEFAVAFNKNLYDMMINKGINTLGPFKNYDEMTFPDKKNSDLIVSPEINFIFSAKQVTADSKFNSVVYTYDVSIGGSLDLSINEPLSKEKMWLKKLDFNKINKTITFELGGNNSNESLHASIDNAFSEMLVDFFNTSIPTISKYFNSEELLSLKKQSQELRVKKNY